MGTSFDSVHIKKRQVLLYLILFAVVGFSFWDMGIVNKTNSDDTELSSEAISRLQQLQKNEMASIYRKSIQKMPTEKTLPTRFSSNPAFKFFELLQNKKTAIEQPGRKPASE